MARAEAGIHFDKDRFGWGQPAGVLIEPVDENAVYSQVGHVGEAVVRIEVYRMGMRLSLPARIDARTSMLDETRRPVPGHRPP